VHSRSVLKIGWKLRGNDLYLFSLLGLENDTLCTNTAINSHFTTLLTIGMVLSDFIFILIVFDIYSLHFYFNVYHLRMSFERIWYGMVWYTLYACARFIYTSRHWYDFLTCWEVGLYTVFRKNTYSHFLLYLHL